VTTRGKALDPSTERTLCDAARAARAQAYAPYSRFLVGAALLADDGTVYAGANIENASYGLCLCAERSAIAHALARGERRFRAMAVATASVPPSSPCGMCRQVLAELAPGIAIVLCNDSDEVVRTDVTSLLPMGFDATLLASGRSSSGGEST